ncbi:hypothetical protein EV356DRAFT_529085 [Viridothelium virens]|uniref:Uncharacterized protein n=1 Tax=Viridothelium virens TaxID=1048519 RepID=A0A6A6HM63_VIRVR|nr:hypothetical protein EV356DRAFT_529085 [Viridothelium virens]
MALLLGKRKRRTQVQEQESGDATKVEETYSSGNEDIQTVFRRAFEARFKPLEERRVVNEESNELFSEGEEQDDESEWGGLESEDDRGRIQVIEYSAITEKSDEDELLKQDMKAFMSSKPPSNAKKDSSSSKTKSTEADSDDEAEVTNLKNDLALQRLLRESHLLEASSGSDLSGHRRHKAIDLRLASLGAKKPALQQDKMPMAHRKGIIAKAQAREGKRRREAQENGIILEKAVKAKKKMEGKRERGIGAPGVGSFRGGTLVLSRRDVASIRGPRGTVNNNGKLRR